MAETKKQQQAQAFEQHEDERGRFVLDRPFAVGMNLDLLGRQVKDDAAVDDEPGHWLDEKALEDRLG